MCTNPPRTLPVRSRAFGRGKFSERGEAPVILRVLRDQRSDHKYMRHMR